ncbi:class I SAM-dependent methyltransferase [Allochromatium vinosum]|uniref:Methyltransferase type 12 n=1 Tax=Allochromatium vinosum (strain ATCC 17899 / DSM 180 / NBRC 103801 / NCIMB 10441 / D) TaxID=572477 RepID=D3RU63_ALLVD|nr:class I SAM-dependent methyltransferase [Allochromatium vinosum]ADC62722.1 Methyltransferase type 12 [Allochromatium vinosum DSM 180]
MKCCPLCETAYARMDWHCPACDFEPLLESGIPILAPELAQGGAGFHAEAFAELADLEAENFWFRARNYLIVWALRRHFPRMRRYLEIGCGTGYVLAGVAEAYPQADIAGSEVFSVGLPFAATRVNKAELLQMDARRIPYADEFDVIGAFDVLEHIEEDATVLMEMRRALRSEGGIAITVPQHPWLWSRQDDYACHVRRYRVGELREKVSRVGFTVVFETSFVSLLLPAMLASRLTQSKTSSDEDHFSELRLPTLINRIFETTMDLERLLIRIGLRFPIGGSRLLIARKSEVGE